MSFAVIGITTGHAVSRQRPRQDGDGPVSGRSAMVDAMNGSAIAAAKLCAIFSGDPA
ncbi:hypothetical protein OHA25_38280 [Nonomuraea sp. NBC_00507]|uniref:hypothetical protein n=1 Tax=Nonomuraea sp. NBC_00507 TaxID=2976002 RepID=UPI002E17B5E6